MGNSSLGFVCRPGIPAGHGVQDGLGRIRGLIGSIRWWGRHRHGREHCKHVGGSTMELGRQCHPTERGTVPLQCVLPNVSCRWGEASHHQSHVLLRSPAQNCGMDFARSLSAMCLRDDCLHDLVIQAERESTRRRCRMDGGDEPGRGTQHLAAPEATPNSSTPPVLRCQVMAASPTRRIRSSSPSEHLRIR